MKKKYRYRYFSGWFTLISAAHAITIQTTTPKVSNTPLAMLTLVTQWNIRKVN